MEIQEKSSPETASRPILTEQERSALVDPKPKDEAASQAAQRRGRVVPFDFRCPDRASKEQVRSLYLLHDALARHLSTNLPTFLRTICEVTLISLEQRAYADHISSLPDPAAMFKLSMSPFSGLAALEISPSIAFPIIDCQLGGGGQEISATRALTDIEQEIMAGPLEIITEALRNAWKPVVDISFRPAGLETSPKMLQIVAPNEIVIVMVFHMQVGEARGTMSLCIPAVNIEPIFDKLSELSYSQSQPDVSLDQTTSIINKVAAIKFAVSAELFPTSARMSDLIKLSPGDVLRLEHRVEEPVNISVGGIVKFRGDLATHEKRTAVYIRPLNQRE